MWETAKKTFNQTEWVYDCSWWQRALKDFSQRVFANLRDSSRCGKPVKPSGSVCQSQRTRKKSSHPTLLRKYCQVIKQIQPPYRRKYWRFCKINQVDHFPFLLYMGKICHFWGQKWHFRRSNQNSRPLLCDKYPLGNLKLFLFFPLFVKPTFLLFFRGGRFSWGVELRNATSDANRASTTFLQQPNGSESWDFRQLKKKFEFLIEIKLGFHCTLDNN